MIKKEIQELESKSSRNNIPSSSPKIVRANASFYSATQKRCGGCGRVLVDNDCPECSKVVVL